jgi:N-acetylglucosamine-6-sulfatase
LLNEKRFLLVATAGLFLIFSLLASSLFNTIITSRGGGFIQEASSQEEETADDDGEGAGEEPTVGEAATTTTEQLPLPPTEDLPNILLIVSDDQPFYTANYTPAIINEIFAKGTTFSDAFLTTSLCCPSRASILTGLYAHNHGVIDNKGRPTNSTFFQAIKDNENLGDNYRTAMVGKYLNSQSGDCRNEFDYWVAFPGTGPWYNGTNQPLNVNCDWMQFNNTYSTYLLRDYALQFLNDTITEGKPFVMQFAPFNPHSPTRPAPEDANLYPNGLPSYYLPPSFNEADVSDKPAWVQALPSGCQEEGRQVPASECETAYKERQLKLARNLASLDRSVEALLDFLESKGELSNTLIIYINDNGAIQGEHRTFNNLWTSKNVHYKESVKAIIGVRWDDGGHIPIGQTSDEFVGNIDIAPTIYDVLGLTPPYPLDGRSLMDLWRADNSSSEPWRESILLEHWNPRYTDATIVTKSWSYTETKGDKSELYDRVNDPYELNNLWCPPHDLNCAYSATITNLAAELRLLHPSWDSALARDTDKLEAKADRLDARADKIDAAADRAEARGNDERAAELREAADRLREDAAELRLLRPSWGSQPQSGR